MNFDKLIDKVVDDMVGPQDGVARGLKAPSCNWCWVCPECRSQIVEEMVENGANRVGAGPDLGPIHKNLGKLIDHTLLKPEATKQQIIKLCDEAVQFGFASVCVNPCWVRVCRDRVRGSEVLVCTVVGFPLGANTTETKAFETQKAIEEGADEIDMVANIGMLKSGEYNFVERDIHAVVDSAGKIGRVKVILETCYLTDDEKIKGALLAKEAGADFVKTSTGFGKEGATLGDVALLRKVVGSEIGVKAAGGIRDYQKAVEMVEAGANRIGASASVAIIGEVPKEGLKASLVY
jgi:deoxyribose-phosphate aldolase